MTQENLDKLDLLLYYPVSVAEEDRDIALFDSMDTAEVQFDKRYFRRRDQIILRQKYLLPVWHETKKILSRVAVFLFAIFLAAFVTILSVAALRENIWNVFVDWYQEYVVVHFSPEAEDTEPPKCIETFYKPAILPDGAEEEILEQDIGGVTIDYYIGDEWVLSYWQRLLDQFNTLIDSDNASSEAVTVQGHEGFFLTYADRRECVLVWSNGKYAFYLESTEKEQLFSIAESVSSFKP